MALNKITGMDIPTFEDMFGQIRNNFNLCGIPLKCNRKLNLNFYLFMILLLTLCSVIVGEISFFVVKISSNNFLELTQLAPCIGIGILSVLKICSMMHKKNKIIQLSNCLNDLYSNILSDIRHTEIVKNEMNTLNLVTKYYFILNKTLITVYNFSPFILAAYSIIVGQKVELNLPYAVIIPISIESWANWIVVYLHQIIAGFVCVLFFTTVDALYCVLCCHVCNNFTVLCHDIQHLEVTDNLEALKNLIIRHQYILKLSEDLEDIFKAANLFNVLVGSLQICALGFNLTMGDWSQAPGCTLFLASVLINILMMSVFGEKLLRESTKIRDAAYSSTWYDMNFKSKKFLLILMSRSNKPQKLTAFKFSVITYETFTKIISRSWTYFTILKTVYIPAEASDD